MRAYPRSFLHLLGNNLAANITNYTVWFALTFWVFLQTRSVFATGMIAGLFLVMTAALAFWLGSLVDHHRKKQVMMGSSLVSLSFYLLGGAVLAGAPEDGFASAYSPWLWLLVVVLMCGVIAGNARNIALPTVVTAMIPAERRDRANGLVGMVTGIGFLTTSAVSGLLVAWGGMIGTLIFALVLTVAALVHLWSLGMEEPEPAPDDEGQGRRVDLRGTIRLIASIPGLFALILFATFNNFLGGVFMALLDAYGLSMMSVQSWGLLWAFVSCAFILSGIVIARTGLGANPLRTLLLVNLGVWAIAAVFTIQPSIILLAAGCFGWLFLGPYAEAAEQTTLQKVVPYGRQGRVFGFAQSVEQAASPLTAFLIGPLTQFIVIPFMTTGTGAEAIGDWVGRGPERGIALVFTISGLLGLIVTVLAFRSRQYRQISAVYRTADPGAPQAGA